MFVDLENDLLRLTIAAQSLHQIDPIKGNLAGNKTILVDDRRVFPMQKQIQNLDKGL